MVYVERPKWMDRFMGDYTEWLVYTPGGKFRYVRAGSQEEALEKAVRLRGVEVSGTNDIRPRTDRSDAKLMTNPAFLRKLRSLLE